VSVRPASPDWLTIRARGRFSFRLRRRDVRMIAGFLLLMTAAFLVSLVVGDYHTSPGAAIRALLGEGSYDTRLIVRDFRLPRASEAVLVGGMLGLSGAIFQAIARNPLVTPDIIGVNGGASLAALAVIVLGAPLGGVPFAAFGGALGGGGGGGGGGGEEKTRKHQTRQAAGPCSRPRPATESHTTAP
jgi:iron complex transport system permease protein